MSARSYRSRAAVLGLLFLLVPWSAAGAEDAPPDQRRVAARAAFLEAIQLAEAGRWADALAAFTRSDTQKPHPLTAYNMAYCEEVLGHYASARKLLRRAITESGAEARLSDREEAARELLRRVEGRLARVQVTITPVDATLEVDGRPLEVEVVPGQRPRFIAGTLKPGAGRVPPTSRFEVLLDPGHHVFILSRQGRSSLVLRREVAAGASARLDLRLEEPPPPPPPGGEALRLGGYAFSALGAAGLVMGGIAGVSALVARGDADEHCFDGRCNEEGLTLYRHSQDAAAVANVAMGAGLAVGAAGVVMLLSAGSTGETKDRGGARPTVGVVIGGSGAEGFAGIKGRW